MQIKDFSVGQTVFICGSTRRNTGTEIKKAEVAKVGRKYVTLKSLFVEQFKEPNWTAPYLVEQVEYGTPRLLFPSEEAVCEYMETEELRDWLRKMTDWDKIGKYTLDQLRAVREILGGADNG